MKVINGTVSDEIKQHLIDGGFHPVARRHGNLIIAGGNLSNQRVLKLVVTGGESFTFNTDNNAIYLAFSSINGVQTKNIVGANCTHFTYGSGYLLAEMNDGEFILNASRTTEKATGNVSFKNKSLFTSKDAAVKWFKEQYSKGTPVTVAAFIEG